jgi:type I restriction enzyme M protein
MDYINNKQCKKDKQSMIDNKKEQERANLHSTIWRIANDLRGSVDGWDFKQYVLGLLFYRFISENLSSYIAAFKWLETVK